MNPQLARFKSRKARPCTLCQRRTKLRVTYEDVGKVLANRCLCMVCLQALGMMAQAQKMLGEEDDTLLPAEPLPPPVVEDDEPVGYSIADAIDEVTAEGYKDRRNVH